MTPELLYDTPQARIAVILVAALLLASELGYRLARRGRQPHSDLKRTQITSIQAGLLGLLSLLLGFTFAMALSRFEYRKQMVVQESNAIGTVALRSQFPPASRADEVSGLLGRYVRIRLESVVDTAQASAARARLDIEATQLQRRLRHLAHEAAEADVRSVPLGLLTHSVNELIDIKTKRDIAVANHVPESVLLFLMGLAVLAAGVLGYGNGLAGARIISLTAAYSIIVVLAIVLILDLDRPQQGLARVSQASMAQLEELLGQVKR
jgi:hypothetical protein